jgi:vitamin B12 transporter
MSGKHITAAIAALVISLAPAAGAQDQGDTESFLDTLVVTAIRTLESIRDVPQNMEVISEEQIRASGATDVTDILEEHGILINYQYNRNYGNDSVKMRGFETSTHGFDILSGVQVLVNGRRIGLDSLSIMGLHAIERIEIIHGPGSVMYGSAGMGGVINIITKRGRPTPEARAEVGIGENGEGKASIFGAGTAGRFDIAAAANYSEVGDYTMGNGEKMRHSGTDGRYGYYLNAGWSFNDSNRIGLNLQGNALYNAKRPMGTYATTATYPAQYKGRPYFDSQDKALHSGDLMYEGASESLDLTWIARYYYGQGSYGLFRESLLADGSSPRDRNSFSKSSFQGAQAQVGWDYGVLHVTAGVDWYENHVTQDQFVVPYTTRTNWSNASTVMKDLGFFLLAKISLLERRNLVLTAGIRYDKFTTDIDSRSDNEPEWSHDTRTYTKTLPSFGVAWSPTEYLKLRANVGEAFRVPSPRQLIGNFFMGSTSGSFFIGNKDLKPEESLTWDFGADFDYGNILLSATYFSTDFKNYIGTTSGGPSITKYINVYNVRMDGIEAAARYNVGRAIGADFDLTPWVGLTRMLKFETDEGKKLADISRLTFAAGLDFSYPTAGLTARVKAVYFAKPEIDDYTDQLPPDEVGGAMVFDFSVTKTVASFGDQGDLSISATVNNVFNKEYSDVGSVNMPGRAIYFGLVSDYEGTGKPFLIIRSISSLVRRDRCTLCSTVAEPGHPYAPARRLSSDVRHITSHSAKAISA